MKFPSIELVVSNFLQTVKRFPLAIFVAVIAMITSLNLIDNEASRGNEDLYAKILMTCSLAMPMLFSFHAVFEQGKKKESFVILGLGLIMLVLFYMGISSDSNNHDISHIWGYRFFMWNGAFHLLSAFCTFYLLSQMNGFWQWNRTLFLSFILATLYSVVLYAGLAIALAALQQLFNIHIDEKLYLKLWVVIALVFQPFIFLGSIPTPISELQNDRTYPTGLRIFTQYILLPLVMVYFVILYLYMGKILILWNLPKGWVSYLIISFSVAGILSLLLLHPLIEKEEYKWVAWVNKLYYLLLIPLVVLMLVSIGVRIHQYGITPNRYIILVLALWLGVLSVYYSLSKKRNIILIPLSLAMICVLCSFGPWGIFGASTSSQTRILKEVLTRNHLFENGKFVAAKPEKAVELSDKDAEQVRSSFDLLNHLNYGDNIREWIPKEWENDTLIDQFNLVNTNKLSDKLGFTVSARGYDNPNSPNEVTLTCQGFDISKGINVSGYQHFANISACVTNAENCYSPTDNENISCEVRNKYLVFHIKEQNTQDSLPLMDVIDYAKSLDLSSNYVMIEGKNAEKMKVEKTGKAKLLLNSLQVTYKKDNESMKVNRVDGYLMW